MDCYDLVPWNPIAKCHDSHSHTKNRSCFLQPWCDCNWWMQWAPSLFVTIAVLSSLFSSSPIQYVPFIVFGTYGAWMYLRYFQRKPEAGLKGDTSAEFAFATFFPAQLQYASIFPLKFPCFAKCPSFNAEKIVLARGLSWLDCSNSQELGEHLDLEPVFGFVFF